MMVWANLAAAGEYEIGQNRKRFTIDGKKVDVLRINVGDTVRFKNEDPFFHGIYSISDISTFELGAFRKGQSRSVIFNKAGRAEIECAVHSDMYMIIEVNDLGATKRITKRVQATK
jgi:plastocyanin